MTDLISKQAVLDIADDLRDRMTVVGYCAMTERVKALPSATCGNLEKPEIPQHSEGEAADCNLDCISRQAALRVASGYCHPANIAKELAKLPSAQPEITYQNCSDALLKMWMDNVLTDGEYNRIMDKLNKFDTERRTDG